MLKRLPLLLLILLAVIPTGNSHGPVTTKVTFNREVIRILGRHCIACHSPGRIRQELPLTTYAEARPWAKAIKEEILNRRMAPFQAVKGFGLFQESHALTQHEQDQLISWIDGGAPKGEQKDYPVEEISRIRPRVSQGSTQSTEAAEWPDGQPDLVLEPRTEMVIAPGSGLVAQCVTLPVNNSAERWISRIDFAPGQPGAVFNATFSIATTGRTSRQRDNTGCAGSGKGRRRLDPLGEWVPGQPSIAWPAGMAMRLPPNAEIVLTITYQRGASRVTDRSRLALYFDSIFTSRSNPKVIEQLVLFAPNQNGRKSDSGSSIKLAAPLTMEREIVGIRPLLFPHGSSLEARLNRPDGSAEVLILARGYKFDWQPTYFFRIPRPAQAGSVIDVTTYHDPAAKFEAGRPLCQIVTARPLARHTP
jgi:hypothetical protein